MTDRNLSVALPFSANHFTTRTQEINTAGCFGRWLTCAHCSIPFPPCSLQYVEQLDAIPKGKPEGLMELKNKLGRWVP
jgi:hypothetical protein